MKPTQEQVIAWAREAGFKFGMDDPVIFAAHERAYTLAYEAGRKDENEACARMCEEGIDMQHPVIKEHIMKAFEKSPLLAAAIRARREQ